MIQWEYKVRVLGESPGTIKEAEFLREQGKEGWELCAVYHSQFSGSYYYFKRQITQP
jgi:hypothetical protein